MTRCRGFCAAAAAVVVGVVVIAIGCGGMRSAAPAAESASSDSITNNQEAGVDEGGIVKAWGDYLVVLRRGRLFTVRLGDRDLAPICRVDAHAPGSDAGTWYDEMLVRDEDVIVVGYSYEVGATEIGRFRLDPQGCIHYVSTHFLHSNDYYSSRNYASRLVDGKLVFYMPHYLGHFDVEDGRIQAEAVVPSLRAHGSRRWRPLITSSRIHVPELPRGATTLHTVVSCDLRLRDMQCSARAVVGGFGRTFYVSQNAVYVWVQDGWGPSANGDGGGAARASLYRLPLDGGAPAALRAWGMPTDQFSFDEGEDGTLHVLLREAGYGDWMGGPEASAGAIALARFDAGSFARHGLPAADVAAYTALPVPEDGRPLQNRFVGDYVLYGTGTSWGYAAPGSHASLWAHSIGQGGPTTRIDLPHGVDRIEALSEDAVVIGSDGSSLHFTSIALDGDVRAAGRFVRANASQGELRSHGFFYKPDGPRHGILGLPIRREGGGFLHLYEGSAEILYLEVDGLSFDRLGALAARNDDVDDDCQVSCVDWYGNARPVFYRGRVFALLGYELVEGVVREGRIVEVGRAHLIADMRS